MKEILLDFTFNWRGRRDELPVCRPMPPLASAPEPAPFWHQPPCDGDREAMAAPAPTRHPNLWLVLLIRSQGPMPRASAPRRTGILAQARINREKWEALQVQYSAPLSPASGSGNSSPC